MIFQCSKNRMPNLILWDITGTDIYLIVSSVDDRTPFKNMIILFEINL